jgi:hypothetical protein
MDTLADADEPDCRQLFADIVAIVVLSNAQVPTDEPLTAILLGNRIAVAAGPGSWPDTLVAVAYIDLIDGPVCVLSSDATGEVRVVHFTPGAWVVAVTECATNMRGGYVPDAKWLAPSSQAVN